MTLEECIKLSKFDEIKEKKCTTTIAFLLSSDTVDLSLEKKNK